MVDKYSFTPVKSDKLVSNNSQALVKNSGNISQNFSNMKTVDVTSRLGQFAWRQITPSTISLPVIFRHHHREEYLCVQMINIHLLSKFPPESVSYSMKQSPIHYFSLTEYEAKLFQCINKFHSNGYLSNNNNNQLDYSRLDLAYITPFTPFLQFYQFISSNSQLIQNNAFWISSKKSKSNTEREKEHINVQYSSEKMVSSTPNERKSSNSYCRSTFFRGKEVISYSTTSSIDSNETILCLSIKDIVLTYFPSTTPEEFLQLCRLKQIVRFKPDKSTNSDSSLRLINMHQLDRDWDFFNQQLLPNHQSQVDQCNNEKSNIIEPLPLTNHSNDNQLKLLSDITEQSFDNISKIVQSSSDEHLAPSQEENPPCEMDSIQTKDNEDIHIDMNSSMDQQIEITQENLSENNIEREQNELTIGSSENKQEEEEVILSTIQNKIIKKKRRRRSQKHFLTLKRRKPKQIKSISNEKIQLWINKYSIEPISIRLQREKFPID